MNKELPALWALDKAAELTYLRNWAYAQCGRVFERDAIIAHARTLEKYEKPPEDPDKLAVRRILAASYCGSRSYDLAGSVLAGDYDGSNTFQSALAAYKQEKVK